ncbi:MAG: phenylalanine--tRNA ligase subunit alpha, partial [Proteobacteria bacterium]
MDLKSLDLEVLEGQVKSAQAKVSSTSDLEMLKRDWLGKDGTVKSLFAQLKEIDPAKKAEVASRLNKIRDNLEGFIAAKEAEFSSMALSSSLEKEFVDLSLPAKFDGLGKVHPITQVERKIAAILRPFGFENVLGPEIETEYFCFDSLNIPKHHPARDMQDTFYTESGHVLRTHTTSVQARVLKKGGLPVKVASFGRVFRNEKEDASHQAMFHQ